MAEKPSTARSSGELRPDPADDRLRQVSAGILQLLSQSQEEGSLRADIQAALVRRLTDAFVQFAGDLRHELPTLLAAIQHLDRLSDCRILPARQLTLTLRNELKLAETQAREIFEFLEELPLLLESASGESVSATLADCSRASETICDGVNYFVAEPGMFTPISPWEKDAVPSLPSLQDGVQAAIPTSAAETCSVDRTSRIRSLWVQGNEQRRQGDFAQAIGSFTELLELAPDFVHGYLERGQALHLASQHQQAVADFTRAIGLDREEAEAYSRRGDAWVQLGEFEAATTDYDEALRLRPGLLLARMNRAVVYHLCNEHERAIAEFSEILALQPDCTAGFYNRGLAHMAARDYQQATQDFTKAIELDPEDTEASAKLREAQRMVAAISDAVSPVAEEKSSADKKTSPSRAARRKRRSVLPSPSGGEESSFQGAAPTPQGERGALSLAARSPTQNQVEIKCPHCKAIGFVRWDRLGALLTCSECARHFRIDAHGSAVAVAKSAGGKWVAAKKPRGLAELALQNWKIVAATLCTVFFLTLGTCVLNQPRPMPAPVELPQQLEPRAELLARAWLSKDHFLIRRLTLSSHEKTVYRWLQRNPPPLLRAVDPSELEKLRIEIQLRGKSGRTAQVVAGIVGLGSASNQARIEFKQGWEERDAKWFFVPPGSK